MHFSKSGAGIALGATLVVGFILCTLALVIFPGPQFSHAWIALFTTAPAGTLESLIEGVIASAVVGLILGWCFAHCYNWTIRRK